MMDRDGREILRGTCPRCKTPDALFEFSVFAGDDGGFVHRDWRCTEWTAHKYVTPFEEGWWSSREAYDRYLDKCEHCHVPSAEHLTEKCTYVLSEDDIESVKKEFAAESVKALLEWKPEDCPKRIREAYEANGAEPGAIPPFFSEVYLYELLGKEDARTLLALMRQVLYANADVGLIKKRVPLEL